jgi:hypothetical protein
MKRLLSIAGAVCLFIGVAVVAAEYCDDMETDLWTLGHENPSYDGTWIARYDTDRAHSPVRSIRTSLHGGGRVGLDADHAYAARTFTLCGATVESVMVWYNSYGVSSGSGPTGLDAACKVIVQVYDVGDNLMDSQVYCVLAFDDNTMHSNLENMPGWIYQECRPDEYEPGAPDYCRLADGSIQPPTGWWYRLKVSPVADMVLDWTEAAYMKVQLEAFGAYLNEDYVGMYWDDFCYKDAPCGVPIVIIHDDTTSICGQCGGNPPVQKDTTDCLELIHAMDGTLVMPYAIPPIGGLGNIWLYAGGSVTVTSTIPCTRLAIQYHCSDGNDGISDIYVDDMVNPLVRIDTYERCDWYVEIKNLCPDVHTVKVEASLSSVQPPPIIPSPHRPFFGIADNDVWYFCFGSAGGPSRTLPTTWGGIKSMYK